MKIMNKSQWKKIATMLLMVSMFSMNTMTQDNNQEEQPTSATTWAVGIILTIGLVTGGYFGYKKFFGKKELTKEEAAKQIAEAQAILDKVKKDKAADLALEGEQHKDKREAAQKAIDAAQKIFDDAQKEINANTKKDDKEKTAEEPKKAPNPAENKAGDNKSGNN